MREIEYRGKRIDTGEWVYGYLVKQFGKFKIYDDSKENKENWIYEVDPKTISQFIGIKDIHQKKVFQGDVASVKQIVYTDCLREEIEEIREFVGEIVWHQFGWHIAEKVKVGIRYYSLWLWNIKDTETDPDTGFMEIIGDRYNNPELSVKKEIGVN